MRDALSYFDLENQTPVNCYVSMERFALLLTADFKLYMYLDSNIISLQIFRMVFRVRREM